MIFCRCLHLGPCRRRDSLQVQGIDPGYSLPSDPRSIPLQKNLINTGHAFGIDRLLEPDLNGPGLVIYGKIEAVLLDQVFKVRRHKDGARGIVIRRAPVGKRQRRQKEQR